jgi:hypothetical protein
MSSVAALRQRWRLLARVAWTALALATLALIGAAALIRFHQLQSVCSASACPFFHLAAADARALEQLGLSRTFYAAYLTAFALLVVIAFVGTAGALCWRASGQRMPLFTAFGLLAFLPFFLVSFMDALVQARPEWRLAVATLQAYGLWFAVMFLYRFPDGRFVPRWTRFVTTLAALCALAPFVLPSLRAIWTPRSPGERLLLILMMSLAVGGLAAQIYRFRRISTPAERQQTKWVVVGLAVYILGGQTIMLAPMLAPSLRLAGLPRVLYYLGGGPLNAVLLLVFLATLLRAILRYRLFEIDGLIRRTLVYSVLTGALALIYLGSVLVLEALLHALTDYARFEIVTVLSTLLIAALFHPLHGQVQTVIDRRFYRSRYDAAATLAAFHARIHNATDLEVLIAEVLSVAEETLQPAHVTLWLRQPRGGARERDAQADHH